MVRGIVRELHRSLLLIAVAACYGDRARALQMFEKVPPSLLWPKSEFRGP